MKTRKIEKIVHPQNFHWVGDAFYTSTLIGGSVSRHRMDPFLLLDYNPEIDFNPRENPRGVGSHPHKGFETVTIAYKGKIEHHDSRGNHGIIGEGDVQWMTAGSGILHQEYHEENYSKEGGLFQMVQLWVNLPAKDKLTTPKYQDLMMNDMTRVNLENEGGFVNVIAGEYMGQKGSGTTFSPINLYNAYLNKGTKAEFSFPNTHNTAILIIDGNVKINDEHVIAKDSFVMFQNEGAENFSLEAMDENTIVLVMSGEPLNEPIAHYGPFVMNTQEELIEAFEEFQAGKFGIL